MKHLSNILIKAWVYQALIVFIVLTGCSTPTQRWQDLASDVLRSNYVADTHRDHGQGRDLYYAVPSGWPGTDGPITIVIEGDGWAWVDRRTPSDNPTPKDPVGWRLARDHQPPAVYMVRPCQYTYDTRCTVVDWTTARYAPGFLQVYQNLFNHLQDLAPGRPVHVIGYSGGAYIALWLAAHNPNVTQVTTVAGVLDPVLWSTQERLTPPSGPLVSFAALVNQAGPQTQFIHYCGGLDRVVPCTHTDHALQTLAPPARARHRVVVIPDVGHGDVFIPQSD